MFRNVILLVSTAGVLVALFLAYSAAFSPPASRDASRRVEDALPTSRPAHADETVRVGPIEVPPGEDVAFTLYDSKSGEPMGNFQCQRWSLLPGSKNEIAVDKPVISMRMPSGMVATIRAAKAEMSADRVQDKRMQPKRGWLEGEASIVIDRETQLDRTPIDQRPQDAIIIRATHVDFDFDRGLIATRGDSRLEAAFFDLRSEAIHFVWSQQENRVEELDIPGGGVLTLYTEGTPLDDAVAGATTAPASAPAESAPAVASKPAEKSSRRRPTTYVCSLGGGIVADQYRGGRRTGGMEADALALTFDVGVDAGDLLMAQHEKQARRMPRTDPNASRLEVRWSGPLSMRPHETPARVTKARRHFEATGSEVKLDLDDRCVVCGKLTYHDESRQLWLTPVGSSPIELALGGAGTAHVASVFADLKARIVKLIGPLTIDAPAQRGGVSAGCELWAELRLAGSQEPDAMGAALALGESGGIESVLLVGDARVGLRDQSLAARTIELFMHPAESGESPFAALDVAFASDDVVMMSGVAPLGAAQAVEALSKKIKTPWVRFAALREHITNAREQSLRCAWMAVGFSRGVDGAAYASDLEAIGPLVLRDASQGVVGRGAMLRAVLRDGSRIDHAVLTGRVESPARLSADAFAVRGRELVFFPEPQIMRAAGPASVRLVSARTLRGDRIDKPAALRVSCNDALTVDGAANQVRFSGAVEGVSRREKLLAESLLLELEDVAQSTPKPTLAGVFAGAMKRSRDPQSSVDQSGATVVAATAPRWRKDLAHVTALGALVESFEPAPAGAAPLVVQNLSAPEMRVDVRKQAVRTTGETTLLMIDRRLVAPDPASAREATGLPSALLSRGPSQTVVQSSRGMDYHVGEGAAARRDSAIFEGEVKMRHVSGRDVVDLASLAPAAANDPALATRLKSRTAQLDCERLECEFAVSDAAASQRGAPPVQLTWLAASQNVYLMDKQGPGSREIYAHQIEFDRATSRVRVLGSVADGIDARIYYINPTTGQFDTPAVGPEFVIDLESNTIKTGRATGGFRRN